jgi:phage regulator Rha-like protein
MNELMVGNGIVGKILTIRGIQVMLDRDLAELYQVETKVLNQTVKRNVERFPKSFMFQLTDDEFLDWRSQIVISSLRSQSVTLKPDKRGQHRKYLPYVFTEQGVAMLSAVLRSETAIKISVQIMKAFVEMRHFVQENTLLLKEINQLKFEQVFNALEAGNEPPKQGVFFDGQIFDAYSFVLKLVRKARISIVLIDNYVDDSVLTLLTKRNKGVSAKIYCKRITKQLRLDLEKHNEQYPNVEIILFGAAHDRFLILDEITVYHIGASLKDLGKKWFAFSKIEKDALKVIEQLKA